MDPATALEELRTLSNQIVEAVITGPEGIVGTGQAERHATLSAAGEALLSAGADVRPGSEPPSRVQVLLADGAVFAVREGERTIVATTVPEPTAGLVVYDLRATLRKLAVAPRRRRAAKKAPDA